MDTTDPRRFTFLAIMAGLLLATRAMAEAAPTLIRPIVSVDKGEMWIVGDIWSPIGARQEKAIKAHTWIHCRKRLGACALEPQRIFRRGSAALPHGDGSGRRQGIALDVPPLPQPSSRLPARTAPQARGECCHTTPALPPNPRSLRVSRRPAASQFLEKARPDLLPGDDIGGILLMPLDAVIQFRALRVRQRQCVGFQAFPHCIQQFGFLGGRKTLYLVSQIAHYI